MHVEPDLDTLRAALDSSGRRFTRQRAEIYGFLSRAQHHPTAEEVYEGVRGQLPRLSLATVYSALEALVDCGLVTKLPAPSGSARFDARDDGHYHLRCLRTGKVEDLPTPFDPGLIARLDPELADRLRDRGFQMTGYRLELVGYFDDPADPTHR